MRLTPEFVSQSSSYLNALNERELDLRGLAIPVIENLASHQGSYDTLNLTDNSLTVLGNIPLAPRLQALHAGTNQISSISPALATNLPNLATLMLTDNSLSSLASLVALSEFKELRYLCLQGNPITTQEHYRAFVIWKVGSGRLHVLDFERIKDAEREAAKALFEENGLPNELARKLSTPTTSSVPGATVAVAAKTKGGLKGRLMTPEEKRRVVAALTAATSSEQVGRLERMLADGLIPEGEVVPAV